VKPRPEGKRWIGHFVRIVCFGTITTMQVLADQDRVNQLIDDLAASVRRDIARLDEPVAMVGIRSRGDVLAQRLAGRLDIRDVGAVDITLYRDDLSEVGSQPVVRTTEVPFDVAGRQIVLVDDVLMTGRSVRAALESLMALGRPRKVWLCVLVDRGGRELPIVADQIAMDISSVASPDQRVKVQLTPTDDDDRIILQPMEPAT